MDKLAKYYTPMLAFCLFLIFAPMTVVAKVDPKIEGTETEKTEKGKKLDDKEKLENDSLEQVNLEKTTPSSLDEKKAEVKSQKDSDSMLSYNFVFYLMYKFKINEIFNLSDKKNKAEMINGQVLYDRSLEWLQSKVLEISF